MFLYSDFREDVGFFFPLRTEKQLQKDKWSTLMEELSYTRKDI